MGNTQPSLCPACGSPVSRRGRHCRSCSFGKSAFKQKACVICALLFTPNSGVQTRCNTCRTICIGCGGKKAEGTGSRYCLKCAANTVRVFKRVCNTCNSDFNSKNNRGDICAICASASGVGLCVGCGTKLVNKSRAFRCNSCSRRYQSEIGTYQAKGWRRYEFNGTRYRSKWEVEAAQLMETIGIRFVYEKKDEETKTFPDFYLVDIGRYLEIHPDCYGAKVKVKDCLLVKTKEHALAYILATGLANNPDKTKEFISEMRDQRIKAALRWAEGVVAYLRQSIYERDEQADIATLEHEIKQVRARLARVESEHADMLAALTECDEAMEYMSEYDIPLCLPERVKSAIAKAQS